MNCKNKLTLIIISICFSVLCFSETLTAKPADKLKTINTCIIYDGPSKSTAKSIRLLKQEILELTSGEFNVVFSPENTIDGKWSPETIRTAVQKKLADPKTDFIICAGVITSNEIIKFKALNKPVIATNIMDIALQRNQAGGSKKEIANLSYLKSTDSIWANIEKFQEIAKFKKISIILNRKIYGDLTFINDYIEKKNSLSPFKSQIIYSENTSDSVLSQLPDKTEAVLFTPFIHLTDTEYDKLVNAVNNRKIPGFSVNGKSDVSKGVLAGLTPGTESKTIIRRIALNFQRILLGEKVESLSTDFSETTKLIINLNTATATGFYPSNSVLSHAEIIDGKKISKTRKLSLLSVIHEARENNDRIKQTRTMVAAGEQDVNKARSYLIPNIDASLTGLRIDKNSAQISFGTESAESVKGSLTATQVLFSEKAWSGWKAVKYGQKAKEEELKTISLDIAFEASNAYINVLRAQTLIRVKKQSLALTKANLSKARLRRAIGTSGASEVYRWESKLAMQKKELIDAKAKIRQAKNNLNRILNRPIHEDFSVEEISFSDPVLCVSNENFAETINNPSKYRILQDFMVKKGIEASSELNRINAAIKAKELITVSAKREFYLPQIAVQGKVTEVYDRHGFDMTSDERDKTSWSVAVNASFPIFTGGAKTSDYIKAKEETRGLKFGKNIVRAQIEEKILYTMETTKASYGAIKHAKDSASAADKNLKLVSDAYARGAVSILELLDAQNASTMAKLGAENSIYDFMADLLSIQRAIGRVDFSKPVNAKQEFRNEYFEYMKNKQ